MCKWSIRFPDRGNLYSDNFPKRELDRIVEIIENVETEKENVEEIEVFHEVSRVSFPSPSGKVNIIYNDSSTDRVKLSSEYGIDEIPNLIKALQRLYDEVKK